MYNLWHRLTTFSKFVTKVRGISPAVRDSRAHETAMCKTVRVIIRGNKFRLYVGQWAGCHWDVVHTIEKLSWNKSCDGNSIAKEHAT